MFLKITVFFIGCFNAAGCQSFNLTRDSFWPFDLVSPFSYRTLSPINIDSATVKVIATPTPLKINFGSFELHAIVNTGDSVRLLPDYKPLTSVTGGILGNGLYIFYDSVFFFAGDYLSVSGVKIDGVGSTVSVQARFYNAKYPNMAAANCHRDGFAILVFNVNVEGYIPNPLFETMIPYLSAIVKSGSNHQIAKFPSFAWFDQFQFIQNYYSYPGSFIDFSTPCKTQYDSATIIQMPKSLATYISIPQFKSFQKLQSSTGSQIVNILPTFPRGSRPVVQASGVVQNFVPTAL